MPLSNSSLLIKMVLLAMKFLSVYGNAKQNKIIITPESVPLKNLVTTINYSSIMHVYSNATSFTREKIVDTYLFFRNINTLY